MIDTFNPDDWIVVWSGRGPLLPERESKPDPSWAPGSQLFNRRHLDKKIEWPMDEDNNGVEALDELQLDRKKVSDGQG
jgi:hypothetical protein